jgi:hypothetical protein
VRGRPPQAQLAQKDEEKEQTAARLGQIRAEVQQLQEQYRSAQQSYERQARPRSPAGPPAVPPSAPACGAGVWRRLPEADVHGRDGVMTHGLHPAQAGGRSFIWAGAYRITSLPTQISAR